MLIGGGVTEATLELRDIYLGLVKEEIRLGNGEGDLEKIHIDYASLGDNAGWVGANISAAQNLRN